MAAHVTYCVGGLSLCNSIADTFAEKSPVIVISGAPGMDERRSNPLLHHRVRDFNTPREVFEKITVASAALEDPLTAFREIDRCLESAARYKRPVYLELPRDHVHSVCPYDHVPKIETFTSDADALRESLAEAKRAINACKTPVIIAGVEMHRFGLADDVVRFAETNSIPMCATLLGKSVVSEKHPLYLGIYEGAMCRDSLRKYVEESDCLIMPGAFLTDIDMGNFTANLDPGKCIDSTSESTRISHHHFHDIVVSEFVRGLGDLKLKVPRRPMLARPKGTEARFVLNAVCEPRSARSRRGKS